MRDYKPDESHGQVQMAASVTFQGQSLSKVSSEYIIGKYVSMRSADEETDENYLNDRQFMVRVVETMIRKQLLTFVQVLPHQKALVDTIAHYMIIGSNIE